MDGDGLNHLLAAILGARIVTSFVTFCDCTMAVADTPIFAGRVRDGITVTTDKCDKCHAPIRTFGRVDIREERLEGTDEGVTVCGLVEVNMAAPDEDDTDPHVNTDEWGVPCSLGRTADDCGCPQGQCGSPVK